MFPSFIPIDSLAIRFSQIGSINAELNFEKKDSTVLIVRSKKNEANLKMLDGTNNNEIENVHYVLTIMMDTIAQDSNVSEINFQYYEDLSYDIQVMHPNYLRTKVSFPLQNDESSIKVLPKTKKYKLCFYDSSSNNPEKPLLRDTFIEVGANEISFKLTNDILPDKLMWELKPEMNEVNIKTNTLTYNIEVGRKTKEYTANILFKGDVASTEAKFHAKYEGCDTTVIYITDLSNLWFKYVYPIEPIKEKDQLTLKLEIPKGYKITCTPNNCSKSNDGRYLVFYHYGLSRSIEDKLQVNFKKLVTKAPFRSHSFKRDHSITTKYNVTNGRKTISEKLKSKSVTVKYNLDRKRNFSFELTKPRGYDVYCPEADIKKEWEKDKIIITDENQFKKIKELKYEKISNMNIIYVGSYESEIDDLGKLQRGLIAKIEQLDKKDSLLLFISNSGKPHVANKSNYDDVIRGMPGEFHIPIFVDENERLISKLNGNDIRRKEFNYSLFLTAHAHEQFLNGHELFFKSLPKGTKNNVTIYTNFTISEKEKLKEYTYKTF